MAPALRMTRSIKEKLQIFLYSFRLIISSLRWAHYQFVIECKQSGLEANYSYSSLLHLVSGLEDEVITTRKLLDMIIYRKIFIPVPTILTTHTNILTICHLYKGHIVISNIIGSFI